MTHPRTVGFIFEENHQETGGFYYWLKKSRKGDKKMLISNKAYDILKFVGQIFLPALAVLVTALGAPDLWNFPYADKIGLTIMAVDTFLNALLQVSSAQYYKEQANGTNHQVSADE